ncbi:MAG: hypothetical protein AB7F75_02355 [Planctomycetota bacterium]
METCLFLQTMEPHITDMQRGMDSAFEMAQESCNACQAVKEAS